jgi:hypothetical protein
MESNFDSEVVGLQFGDSTYLLVVAKDQSIDKAIVSRVLTAYFTVVWTYALDFTYSDAPMLIEYKYLANQNHHSLATKDSAGGFAIARLKINDTDGSLQERK